MSLNLTYKKPAPNSGMELLMQEIWEQKALEQKMKDSLQTLSEALAKAIQENAPTKTKTSKE